MSHLRQQCDTASGRVLASSLLGAAVSFSATDLENLESAIARGELRVAIDGRDVVYRSMDDLIQAYNLVKRQVESATRPSVRRGRYNPYYD